MSTRDEYFESLIKGEKPNKKASSTTSRSSSKSNAASSKKATKSTYTTRDEYFDSLINGGKTSKIVGKDRTQEDNAWDSDAFFKSYNNVVDTENRLIQAKIDSYNRAVASYQGWIASVMTGGISDENARKFAINSAAKKATETQLSIDDIENTLAENKQISEGLKKRFAAANEALGAMRSNDNQAVLYSDFYKGYQPSEFYKQSEERYKQNLGEYKDLDELNRSISLSIF